MASPITFSESNLYYCVSVDYEHAETVQKILEKDSRFLNLVNDTAEVIVNEDAVESDKPKRKTAQRCSTIYPSFNSDVDETRYFFFVDEMTHGGPEFDHAAETYNTFEPTELIKREESYKNGVLFITDLYSLLVKEFKKKKIDVKDNLSLGWTAITCTWIDEDSDEESDPEPVKKTPAKKETAKKEPSPVKKEAEKKVVADTPVKKAPVKRHSRSSKNKDSDKSEQ
jgi:hypothetical protein